MAVTKLEEKEVAVPLAGEEGGATLSSNVVVVLIFERVQRWSFRMLGVLRRARCLAPLSPNSHHPK